MMQRYRCCRTALRPGTRNACLSELRGRNAPVPPINRNQLELRTRNPCLRRTGPAPLALMAASLRRLGLLRRRPLYGLRSFPRRGGQRTGDGPSLPGHGQRMKVVSTISGKTLIGDPMGPSTACLFAATLRPQDSDTQQIYWIDAHSGLAVQARWPTSHAPAARGDGCISLLLVEYHPGDRARRPTACFITGIMQLGSLRESVIALIHVA